MENGLGGGRSSSAASRYSRDVVLTPAKIYLQLEQFHDYYYQQMQPPSTRDQHRQFAALRSNTAALNEQADADDESDDWLALSILELKAPAHLPLPSHPPSQPHSELNTQLRSEI